MRCRKKLAIYFVLNLALSPVCHAQTWQDTVKTIDALFSRCHAENPGCELAISRNGQVIYSKAWGMADLEHHVPLTTASITEAGSVSKQFTAAAVLLLEQQGKLSLDDDVHKYIPELPDYGSPILLRYMMHHSSGLRDWGALAAIAGWPRSTKTYNNYDALDIIVHQHHLNNTPNDAFGYSNSNYNLFAIIVERVSGMSLAAFTRQYIFIPAGMTHTSWRDDHKRIVPDRAIAYAQKNKVYETDMPNEDVYGNGGLLTTAEDLLKWNAWYLGGHLGTPSLLTKQLTTEKLNNGKPNSYAAGLFIDKRHGQLCINHSGATASYRAFLVHFPAIQLSIAWLSNTSEFDAADNPVRQVEDIFLNDPPPGSSGNAKEQQIPVTPPVFQVSEDELKAYTGTYSSDEAQTNFTVLLKEGALYLYRPPQTMIRLTPVDKDHFSTTKHGFDGDKGDIRFNGKQMYISVSRAANVVFDKL